MKPEPGRGRAGALLLALGLSASALVAEAPVAPPVPPPGRFDAWTIYHVYLATFRNGDRGNDGAFAGWRDPLYAGGDLAGLLAALDHVQALGVDAIWISPMFAARSSHGYDVTDYTAIGEAVGVAGDRAASLALWRRLRDEAHARGLKLVLDLPLNHASRFYDLGAGDPWRLRPRTTSARQAAEKLWEGWNAGYRYWNFDDRGTRDFLRRVALHWLVEEGADGLRLDYVRGVPLDFWQELAAQVDAEAPGKLLLGECWADDQGVDGNLEEIARYARPKAGGRAFDALLDFPLQEALVEVFAGRAPADTALLTAYVGGARQPDLALLPRDDLLELVQGEVRSLLGARPDAQPVFASVRYWRHGLPQPGLDHAQRLQAIGQLQQDLPGLVLAGNYTGGVSTAACIAGGEAAAARICAAPWGEAMSSPAKALPAMASSWRPRVLGRPTEAPPDAPCVHPARLADRYGRRR